MGIAVGIVRGERISRRNKLDLVGASLQASKLVIPVLNGDGTEIVAGQGAGNFHAAAVVQLDHDIVDTRFASALQTIAIAVVPHKIAQLGTLQLHHQRLGIAGRINDGGEKCVGRQHAKAAGHGRLRGRNQKIDVGCADDVAVVVIDKQVQAGTGNLRIGKANQFPDGGLHFAKVVLPAKLCIGREVLRQQPIDLVNLDLGNRVQPDRHKRRSGIAGKVFSAVRGR